MAENKYKVSSNQGVVNPYTFIPANKTSVKRVNAECYYGNASELLTGVLHCRLIVQTPLAIPDTENAEKEPVDGGEHNRYPFYRIGGHMAIPGSTIRGELRSVYETITNSCFSTSKDNTISMRVDNSNAYKPGILVINDGTYELYSAKRYLIPIKGYTKLNGEPGYNFSIKNGKRQIEINGKLCQNGDKVKFNYKDDTSHKKVSYKIWDGIVTDNGDHSSEGIIYLGEKFDRKHGESIFVKEDDPIEKEEKNEGNPLMLETAYNLLKKTKDIYRDSSVNKNFGLNHTGYSEFDDLNPANGIPIWYRYDKVYGRYYFSYASIGRVICYNSLNQLVGANKPCEKRDDLCEACLLFGMVGGRSNDDDSASGMGSRVRVTDALSSMGPDGDKSHYVMLKELGSPHISYLPFYARSQSGGIPASYDEKGVSISGRKFYWHHPNAKNDESDYRAEDDERTKRNSTVEVAEPGTEFTFDIFYDGIKEEQLRKLMWAITFGENEENSDLCHKLGHGKPLGLGSVKIVIDNDQRRVFSGGNYRFENTPAGELDISSEGNDEILRIKRIASMRTMEGESIDYPYILDENDNKIPLKKQQGEQGNKFARHQWYSQNRRGIKGEQEPQDLPCIDPQNQRFDPKNQRLKLFKVNLQNNNHSDNKDSKAGDHPNKQYKDFSGKEKTSYKEGEIYRAKIKGYNDNHTSVYIQVNGGKCSMYFQDIGVPYGKVNEDPRFQIGREIEVKYLYSRKSNDRVYYNFKPQDE